MKDGVMINAQAYHDTSLSNLLLTEKCSTGLSFGVFLSITELEVSGGCGPLSSLYLPLYTFLPPCNRLVERCRAIGYREVSTGKIAAAIQIDR